MAKAKYVEYVDRMMKLHNKEFEKFQKIHDKYALNEEENQEEYNKIGGKIMLISKQWEAKLCMQSEKGGYGGYTIKLAEKFQNEMVKRFPEFNSIGIIIEKEKPFSLKRIKL